MGYSHVRFRQRVIVGADHSSPWLERPEPMSENHPIAEWMEARDLPGGGKWPETLGDCDPEIAHSATAFLSMTRASDALESVTRTIARRRRRKSADASSSQTWWPTLRRKLLDQHIRPLYDELTSLEIAERYDVADAVRALGEMQTALACATPPKHLPGGYKSDMRLADEYLQPIFTTLREAIKVADWPVGMNDLHGGIALIEEIDLYTLREWSENPGGVAYLKEKVEHLILCEYYADEDSPSVFDRAEDERQYLSSKQFETFQPNVNWNKPGLEVLHAVIEAIEERLYADKRRSEDRQGARPNQYFCELCDQLAQKVLNEAESPASRTGDARYCANHLPGSVPYRRDFPKKLTFEMYVSAILSEASHDPGYLSRVFDKSNPNFDDVIAHIGSCSFCKGNFYAKSCLDPTSDLFTSLICLHANARRVAHAMSRNSCDFARAVLIDEDMQRGVSAEGAAANYGLHTKKAVGQHLILAVARMTHEGHKVPEIAGRIGVTASAIYKLKSRLIGCVDLSLDRCFLLRWWPFGGIDDDPYIVKFFTPSSREKWRHHETEYGYLTHIHGRASKIYRRATSSSRRPTRSSALR